MSDLIDTSGRGEPVPVAEDCPECGSDETVTSAFAANCDDLDRFSAWCERCGYGWSTDGGLAGDRA